MVSTLATSHTSLGGHLDGQVTHARSPSQFGHVHPRGAAVVHKLNVRLGLIPVFICSKEEGISNTLNVETLTCQPCDET